MKRRRTDSNSRFQTSRVQKREFPQGKKGVVFCKICNVVYFNKSWHHNLRYHPALREDLPVAFTICPACLMTQNKKYEGRIRLINVPPQAQENLENLIHAFTHCAYGKDPMDRLIAIKHSGTNMEVTTTENQLAVRLAKKIKDTHKKTRMSVSYDHSKDKASEVLVEFL